MTQQQPQPLPADVVERATNHLKDAATYLGIELSTPFGSTIENAQQLTHSILASLSLPRQDVQEAAIAAFERYNPDVTQISRDNQRKPFIAGYESGYAAALPQRPVDGIAALKAARDVLERQSIEGPHKSFSISSLVGLEEIIRRMAPPAPSSKQGGGGSEPSAWRPGLCTECRVSRVPSHGVCTSCKAKSTTS